MIDRRDLFRLRMWTNEYNWNCENEPLSSKCIEDNEKNNTKLDTDINIPNEGKYRRKSDGSVEEAYEQAEKEFREWFKLKIDIPLIKSEIPMPFKTHYRRKSDEKHFVFICSEIGKIQMKVRTPEKEVVEKNVGSVMMYGLMSFDISKETVVVDENQLQEEYERLN